MASSGSVNTTGYNGRYLTLSWSQTSQSVANNTTTISWVLKGAGSNTGTWYYAQNFTVVINGITVLNKPMEDGQVKLYNGTVVGSGSLTITHNSDGKKSFSVSVKAGIYDWSPTCTGSGSFDLNKIPRLSSISANDGTLGTAQTLSVTKQDSSFTHTITYKCGSASETIATKSSSTSISWTPPIALASQNTTGTVVSVTFTITTYSGNDNVGSSTKSISCSIPNSIVPSCTINTERVPYVTDTYTTDWWSNNNVYIQGVTKVNATVTGVEAYGSPISSYTVKMENSTYIGQSVTTNAPLKSGNVTITATVTDKRGRSGSITKTISVISCPPCKIIKLTGSRCDSDGTLNDRGSYALMDYEYESGFLTTDYGSNNGATANTKVYYKKHSDYSWTLLTTISDIKSFPPTDWTEEAIRNVSLFQANTANSYDLKLVVTDGFSTTTMTGKVGTAYSLIHWKASGKGIGIGKTSELDDVLDIGMSTKFSGGLTPLSLDNSTDLNDIITPNVYYGSGTSSNYSNFPISSPTTVVDFSLEVSRSGSDIIKQCLTITSQYTLVKSQVYERLRGKDSTTFQPKWGSWVCTSNYVNFNDVYPVGSIYMSMNAANPGTLFGGTWTRISGRFLIGTGSNDANTTNSWGSYSANANNFPAGEKGGEPKHTLSVDEMPSHDHGVRLLSGSNTDEQTAILEWQRNQAYQNYKINARGGDQAHNNMPPYLSVYMWYRTA